MTTTTDPTLTENTDSTTTSSSTLFELTAPRLAVAVDQVDADYAPGETVGIAATNIAVGGSVELSVAHVDAGADGAAPGGDAVACPARLAGRSSAASRRP
jgi:hypothetical protein